MSAAMNGAGGEMDASRHGGRTMREAMKYITEVRDTFHDKREKFDMFFNVMKDYKEQKFDAPSTRGRVKELFKGYNDLIIGFNTFMPAGHKIALDNEEEDPAKSTAGNN